MEEVAELLPQLVVGVEEVEGETEEPGEAGWHEQEEEVVDGPCLEVEEEVLQSLDGKVEEVEEQMLELWKEVGEVVLLVPGQGVEEEAAQSCEEGVGEEDRHVTEEVEALNKKRMIIIIIIKKRIVIGKNTNWLLLSFIQLNFASLLDLPDVLP